MGAFSRFSRFSPFKAAFARTLRRYFTTLTPALSQYLDIPPWKPSTSFVISRDFATTASDDEFLGGTIISENSIVFDLGGGGGGKVRAFCYVGATFQGGMLEGTALAHNDGKLRNVKVTWDDATNAAELLIDGVSMGSTTWLIDGNQDIKYVGKRGAAYGSNVIGEIKLTDGVDNRWYKVDEDWVDNDILVNHAATLGVPITGSDLVTPDTVTTSLSYSSVGGVVTISDAAGGLAYPHADFASQVDDLSTYVVTVTIDCTNSANRGFLAIGNGSDTLLERVYGVAGASVTKTKLLTASGAEYIKFYIDKNPTVAGDEIVFSNISIRKAPGYGNFVNGTSADAEVYTKNVSDGAWVGSKIDHNYLSGGITFDDLNYSFSREVWQNVVFPIELGATIRVTTFLSALTPCGFRNNDGETYHIVVPVNTISEFSRDVVIAGNADLRLYPDAVGVGLSDVVLERLAVRRLIPIAGV